MKELTEDNSNENIQQLEVQSPLTEPKSNGIKIKYVIMIIGITLIIIALIILLIILFINNLIYFKNFIFNILNSFKKV